MSTLIVTPEYTLAESVRHLYLSSASALSNEHHEVVEGFEKAMLAMERVHDYKNIIIVTNDYSPQVQDFVEYIARTKKGALVIATDDEGVRMSFRSSGHHFFVPIKNLDAIVLQSMCEAAFDRFQLSHSIKQLEEVYTTAEQRFRDVADHFSDWLWEINHNLMLTFSSSRKRALEKAEVGTAISDCFLAEEKSRIQDDFADLLESPKAFTDVEYWGVDPYGSRICIALNGVPIFNKSGECIGYRGMGRDVSAHKTSADQLYFLANNDALTGLYNRSRLTDELSRALKRHKRDGGKGALIIVNIDRFRYINDTCGYEAGDRVIAHVAQALRSSIRKGDFLARLSGDEFAIVLSDVQDKDAELRLENFLKIMQSSPFFFEERELKITGSAGLVLFPTGINSTDELFTRANIALKQAKAQGHNSYVVFDEQHLTTYDVSRRLDMLNFVHKCLEHEKERLVLYYQPIVSLTGHTTLERYEVLVRLLDQNGDIVAPIKFIEIAEEHGLISKLDQVVAERAIKSLVEQQKKGRNVSFSINISGRTFEDKTAIENIINCIAEHDIQPGTLVFELTETAALMDLHKARQIIKEFKRHGAAFALDDCGVGYSSFNYIRQLDLDFIKIDGSFVKDLHRNKDDDAFVRAIRDVARRMKIKTVAEMVEDIEVMHYLKQLGIDFAQGYHFAMPAAEFPESFEAIQDKTSVH